MRALSRNVLLYGREDLPPEQTELRAGPLSMVYEAGDLRFISLGDREVLHGIYVAVRDRHWRTVPPVLVDVEMQLAADSFSITYAATSRSDEVGFSWKAAIRGDPDGTINFGMDGIALRTFRRNRIGFCVLHGTRECAGARCEIEHVDGTVERAVFPYLVSPYQPFLEMRAISHEVAPDVWAEVRFSGDIFEMEDQRNWTDASFKTYCTPLRLPFPVEMPEGAAIAQSVTLRLRGTTRPGPRVSPGRVTLTIGGPSTAVPRIGLGVASHARPLTDRELDRLRALNLSHLRVDLRLERPACVQALEQATGAARALGAALETALFLSDRASDELRNLRALLDRVRPPVSAWLVFHTSEPCTTRRWCALVREILAGYDPAVGIGGGTNMYFAQLNRERPPVDALDLICYSVNPQVHAFDNASLVESFEGCRWTAATARQFAASLPLSVTPITLRPRAVPPAAEAEPEPLSDELPPHVDARQMSLFGAAWTVGIVKAFAEAGAHSLTLYETTGWRGVMETVEGSPRPRLFKSVPGAVFPLYHILADVGDFSGGRVMPTTSSVPKVIDGLAFERNGARRVVLGNFRDRPTEVEIEGFAQDARVRVLDERTVLSAMQAPDTFRDEAGTFHRSSGGRLELQLLPFAVACIDAVHPSRGDT